MYNTNICVLIQALIPLALEGTEAGKVKACHALAKIASISNPEIAFPGERVSLAALVLKILASVCDTKYLSCTDEKSFMVNTVMVIFSFRLNFI